MWQGGSGWEVGKDSTTSPLRIIGVSVYHQLHRLPSKSRALKKHGCLQVSSAARMWLEPLLGYLPRLWGTLSMAEPTGGGVVPRLLFHCQW